MQARKHASVQARKQSRKQACKQASKQASKQAGKQASRQEGKQASSQASRQAGKQAGKQASKQARRQVSRQASTRKAFSRSHALEGLVILNLNNIYFPSPLIKGDSTTAVLFIYFLYFKFQINPVDRLNKKEIYFRGEDELIPSEYI